jgi:transcriptional regulator with XRE-family HTH domain
MSLYPRHVATNAREIGPTTINVGAEIQAQRERHGNMTQAQLAAASGVAGSVICRMEGGKSAIDVEQLHRIGAVFGMSAWQLLMLAEHGADIRRRTTAEQDSLYRPDGTLDPGQLQIGPETDAEVIAEIRRRFDESGSG